MENKTFLPKISQKELESHTDAWDYFYAILDGYYEEIDARGDEVFSEMSDFSVMLYIFTYLDNQVNNGGFIQLIFNGYGFQVFESGFIEILSKTPMTKTVKLLKKFQPVYEKYKEKIENTPRDNWDHFAKLYKELPEFEKFDEEYYTIDELEILQKFVKEHISDFVEFTQ